MEKLRLGVSDPVTVDDDDDAAPGAEAAVAGDASASKVHGKKRRRKPRDVRPRWPLGPEFRR